MFRWMLLAIPSCCVADEFSLLLGRVLPAEARGSGAAIHLGAGTALQANYARPVWTGRSAALSFEAHLLASPLREVASGSRSASRDFASLYLTPSARVSLLPGRRIRPFALAGAGYAQYENSRESQDGRPNGAPRRMHGGAFVFGGGFDAPVWRRLAARAEVRNYVTGAPGLNSGQVSGARHHVVVSAGLVLRIR